MVNLPQGKSAVLMDGSNTSTEFASPGKVTFPKGRLKDSTGGSVRFWAVGIVKNNRIRPKLGGTAGQPGVGF